MYTFLSSGGIRVSLQPLYRKCRYNMSVSLYLGRRKNIFHPKINKAFIVKFGMKRDFFFGQFLRPRYKLGIVGNIVVIGSKDFETV